MLPIVHGLEKTFSADVAFLYFDISDPSTADLQKRFGFTATPQFFLVAPDGQVLGEKRGVIAQKAFEAWLTSALRK